MFALDELTGGLVRELSRDPAVLARGARSWVDELARVDRALAAELARVRREPRRGVGVLAGRLGTADAQRPQHRT